MAYQRIPGRGLELPVRTITTVGALTSSIIDATGEKIAWCGTVFFQERSGTKSIRKLWFLFGSVTKAGGSALTVSLQTMGTGGPPAQPDETQDETVAIANGDANFASNTYYQTGALSADRSVSFGEEVCVVVEFDGGGRLGADSVAFANPAAVQTSGGPNHLPIVVLKTGGSWAAVQVAPNILLEFSDGTFGTLDGGFPMNAATAALTFKQDTAGADEYALKINNPFPSKVSSFWAVVGGAADTADFDVVLYNGTTAETGGTVSFDSDKLAAVPNEDRYLLRSFSQEIELLANTDYYLAIKPTQTTSNVRLRYFDVAAAGHFQAHDGGSNYCLASRVDLGSWSNTTTRRPLMGLRYSSFSDGVSSGGAQVIGG